MHLTHRNRVSQSLQVFAIHFRCGPPLSRGEGFFCAFGFVWLIEKSGYDEPSPLERGDHSGTSFGET